MIIIRVITPADAIKTSFLVIFIFGAELVKGSRKPSIYADAAYAVLKRDSSTCTGNFFLDQDVLEEEGVSDFDQYSIDPEATLVSDFFVDDNPEDWIQAL